MVLNPEKHWGTQRLKRAAATETIACFANSALARFLTFSNASENKSFQIDFQVRYTQLNSTHIRGRGLLFFLVRFKSHFEQNLTAAAPRKLHSSVMKLVQLQTRDVCPHFLSSWSFSNMGSACPRPTNLTPTPEENTLRVQKYSDNREGQSLILQHTKTQHNDPNFVDTRCVLSLIN